MFKQLKSKVLTAIGIMLLPFVAVNLWAQNGLTIQPVFKEVRAAAIYEINFTAPQRIPADAQFVIKFPPLFDLTKVNMAGSSTINGGLITKVQGSVVTLQRSGLGDAVEVGKQVQLQFATVKNPKEAKDYAISVEILSGTNARIMHRENRVQIIAKAK